MVRITGTIVWFAERSSLQTNTIRDVNVAKLGYDSAEWDFSRRKGRYNMGIIEVWTIIAVVLHCCGVGFFAGWPIAAMPWQWSCLCLLIWEWGIVGIICAVYIALIIIRLLIRR